MFIHTKSDGVMIFLCWLPRGIRVRAQCQVEIVSQILKSEIASEHTEAKKIEQAFANNVALPISGGIRHNHRTIGVDFRPGR